MPNQRAAVVERPGHGRSPGRHRDAPHRREKAAALTGSPRISARRPMQPPIECANQVIGFRQARRGQPSSSRRRHPAGIRRNLSTWPRHRGRPAAGRPDPDRASRSMTVAKPRAASRAAARPYFSMYSVRPGNSSTVPCAPSRPDATRMRTPSGAVSQTHGRAAGRVQRTSA